MTRDRVTVQEAARRLGVKDDAIRKRIQRGTLETEKDEDGRVYVYLDATHDKAHDGYKDTTQYAAHDGAHDAGADELAEVLREEVAHLRGMIETRDRELSTRAEELRRKDHIIAGLVERVPELPPPTPATATAATATAGGPQGARHEARDGRETAANGWPSTEAPETHASSQTDTQRPPWWLRWLGG